MLSLLQGIDSSAQATESFTTSGSWVCPPGITSITVSCWGAGGGGSTTTGVGGGGGGGAFAGSTVTVVPGTTYNYVVGAGGTSGANGGATTFNATTVVAAGGSSAATNSATGAAGGTVAASTGTIEFAGGNGANGAGSNGGGGGGGAGSTAIGNPASGFTGGNGGSLNGGNGGNGRTGGTQGPGNSGSNYGGGGGGAYNTGGGNEIGGTGAGGLITISTSALWLNQITGTNPNTSNPYTIGDAVAPNLTVSGIGRGPGGIGSNANNRYSANGWNTGGAPGATDYFYFTLTPASGYAINLSSFGYTGQVSAGTPSFAFRSSLDGYTANIGTPNVGGTSISLSAAAYQSITSPITFRFYVYNVASSATTYSINDFAFLGTIGALPTITSFTPTSACYGSSPSVVITGTNFTGATAVSVNNIAVSSFTVNSATQITATLAANTTTGTVKVTNVFGTATSAGSFTLSTAPVVVCPSNITINASPGVCTASSATSNPNITGDCTVTTLTWALTGATTASSPATGINYVGTQTFNAGITTVTYTATDASSNIATCSYTVTVNDTQAPTVSCPANISQNVDAGVCTKTLTPALPTYSDNCAVTVLSWALTGATTGSSAATGINTLPSTAFNAGITTVTYTVKDAANNTSTCSFTVTVTDNILPVVNCPANIAQNVTAGSCARTLTPTAPTYSDNCTVTVLTWATTGANTGSSAATGINTVPSTSFNTGVTTITYTAKDAALNTVTCSFTITITDNVVPTITCPANNAQNVAAGTCIRTFTPTVPTYSDNCSVTKLTWVLSGATVANSPASGINTVPSTPFNRGVTTVTYTATDPSGNTNTCSFTVTITDNINPTIACPGNVTSTNDVGFCTKTLTPSAPTYSDNCTVQSLTWAMTGVTTGTSASSGINTLPSTVFNLGVTTITYTITDNSGNTNTCSFTVTITDGQAPTLSGCPANMSFNTSSNGSGDCTATISWTNPTWSDNCLGSAISGMTYLGTFGGNYYYRSNGNYTWAAARTDAASKGGRLVNIASASENSQITTWIVPTGDTHWIGLNDIVSEGTFIWDGGAPLNYTNWNPGEPNNFLGIEDGTEIHTDGQWNDINTVFSVQPYVMEIGLFQTAGTVVNGATVTTGTYPISYTAIAPGGSSSVCSFTATVVDNETPTLTCPGTQSVNLNASCNATLANYIPLVTKSDNCTAAGSLVVTQSPAAGTVISGAGSTTITMSTTDASGNTGTCSFTLNKIDNTAPFITCPGTQSLTLGALCSATLPDYTSLATKSDNCTASGSIVVTQLPAAGTTVLGVGTTSVTLTATDASGNSSNCSFNVNRVDTTAPAITCPSTQTLNLNGTCSGVLGNYIALASATDNCTASGSIAITQSPVAGTSVSGVGTTTVTLTATDASGNFATCSFNVNRVDVTTPSVICPSNTELALDVFNNATLPNYTSLASATDNCTASGSIVITQSPVAGTVISGATTTTITLTATDASGNAGTCTFDVVTMSNTVVQLSTGSGTYTEAGGTISIPVTITNPSSINPTSVDLVLISGSASGVNSYTTQTVVFPAGSSAVQNASVTISENTLCSDNTTFGFQLQNISGGLSAALGATINYSLNVTDNDLITTSLLNDNVEDGDITDWQLQNALEWEATGTGSLNGSYSFRHVDNGMSGSSYASKDLDDQLISGLETTWRFNFSHFGNDPNTLDNFLVFLNSDDADLSGSVNGYAVGVNPASNVAPDWITLWKVVNGVPTSAIVTSSIDLDASHGTIGIEVVRNEAGLWTLRIDSNGDFDNLINEGTATDTQFGAMEFFGVRYNYTATTSGDLAVDDMSISQTACPDTWYSQGSGDHDDVIWSKLPMGTSQSVYCNIYQTFVVQSGHVVGLDSQFEAKNLEIQASGTLNSNAAQVTITGDLTINGTFNADNSNYKFKGSSNQSIISTSNVLLNSVEVKNNNALILPAGADTYVKEGAVIRLTSGDLNTNDRLILKASASGTASIGRIAPASDVVGQVTMQQYVPQMMNYPYGSWVALGCPVLGQTISDWNDDIITSGFPGSDFPPPYSFTNIQYYNEAVAGDQDLGYTPVTALTETLQSNRGYFVYMQTPTQALDVKGNIYQHSFNAPLSYTNSGDPGDGWNLLVNQYPSEVDFRNMVLNGSGVASAYWYDSESANFKVYNGIAQVGTASRYIPANQSFFVKASGAGNYLRYDEDYKTNNGVIFERELPEDAYANFKFSSFNLSSDECLIYFSNDASSAYEWNYDAMKMESAMATAAECALVSSDNIKLTLDARPMSESEITIPVYIEMPEVGQYIFEVLSAVNIPFGSCLHIEDTVTGEIIPVEAGQMIVIENTAAYAGNRLLIHVSPPASVSATNESCAGLNDGTIEVTLPSGEWNIELLDESGNLIQTSDAGIVFSNVEAGSYQITAANGNGVCSSTSTVVEIMEPVAMTSDLLSSEVDLCNNSASGSIEWIVNNANGEYHFTLTNSDLIIVSEGNSSEEIMTLNGLSADIYTLAISSACDVVTTQVDIKDPNAVSVQILSDDQNLVVEIGGTETVNIAQSALNTEWSNWYLNSSMESTSEEFTYSFDTAGDYELILNAGNGSCVAADTITIHVEVVAGVDELNLSDAVTMLQIDNSLVITLNEASSEMTSVKIMDMTGNLVWNNQVSTTEGKVVRADLTSLAQGAYMVYVSTGEQISLVRKFVK